MTVSIGYLAQDAYLFDTSVAENVRIGNRDATDAEVADALVAARLDLPLDRRVGLHGGEVSGGEARRIALARLLVRPHPVLILDEPTEHLDAPTATALLDDLWRLADGSALLVITHDPAARRLVRSRDHPRSRGRRAEKVRAAVTQTGGSVTPGAVADTSSLPRAVKIAIRARRHTLAWCTGSWS